METPSQNPNYELAHFGITVSNLSRSIGWYQSILGFQKIKEFHKPGLCLTGAILALDSFFLEILQPYRTSPNQETSQPSTLDNLLKKPGANHIALSVPDINKAYAHLEQNKVKFITPIQDSKYFFCLDPDETLLEIKQKA